MGNVQTSSIANQLLPFESYIAEIPELSYVTGLLILILKIFFNFWFRLGATRFMKVARVDHADGPLVVKVFVIVDQLFSIEPYRDQLLQISRRLNNHPNCSPTKRVFVRSNCNSFDRTED